jgi:hypothetical protein
MEQYHSTYSHLEIVELLSNVKTRSKTTYWFTIEDDSAALTPDLVRPSYTASMTSRQMPC